MKIFFAKTDSIYKIFKTLKKIPPNRSISIVIDEQNSFFDHTRRGFQLKEVLKQQHLHATFPVTTKKQEIYYQAAWLAYFKENENGTFWLFWFFKDLFSTTKSAHEKLLVKKNFISYLMILSELAVILLVLYMSWWMISPNARLQLQPAYTIDEIVYNFYYYPSASWTTTIDNTHITIPYAYGSVPFEHTMTVDVSNITFDVTPAKGFITFYNTTNSPISLLASTKLVTDEGVLFQTDERVDLPAWTKENPWQVSVSVTALETLEDWSPIGELGNIEKETVLRIKNLPESMAAKQVYAIATVDFAGWSTTATWTVVLEDIERIEQIMMQYMEDNKSSYLKEHLRDANHILFPFPELLTLEINEFITTSSVGDAATFVEGKIKATIKYAYVTRNDIQKAVDVYLKQRPSQWMTLFDYDKHSVTFFELRQTLFTGHYLIPTKTNVVRGYDFTEDRNGILEEVKGKIVGLNKEDARSLILTYPEISQATISLSPPRYDTLPQVTSRITVRTQEIASFSFEQEQQ